MHVPVLPLVLGAITTSLVLTGTVLALTGPAPARDPGGSTLARTTVDRVDVRPVPVGTSRPRPVTIERYGRFGFDISWPQCRKDGSPVLPPPLGPLAIVGITDGRPFSTNRCLAAQGRWARTRAKPGAYVNLAFPRDGRDPAAYGAATVRDALARAAAAGLRVRSLWLDVEIGNHWSVDPASNERVVRGAEQALAALGLPVGVYSSLRDWQRITGDARLTIPVWKALPDGRRIVHGCGGPGFAGRTPDLVQAVFSAPDGHQVDGDLVCTLRPDLLRVLG